MAICPSVNDATSFYRAAWPLSRLQKNRSDVSVYFQKIGKDQAIAWAEISLFDILFLQRPYTPWEYQLLTIAKDIGVKVWCDYDDDLLNVEIHNPAFKTYSDPKIKDNVTKIAKAADLLTFSTEHLKSKMSFGNPNAHVVRNATDFDLLALQKSKDYKRLENVIFWRGSKSHDNDLFLYADALGKIAKKNRAWKFGFLGNPWFGLLNFIPQDQMFVIPKVDLPKYFHFMKALQPDISIAPLADSVFNRSKSNIAWQEATISSSPCLCPDFDEWREHGAVLYKNPDSFSAELQHLIDSKERRVDFVSRSRATLESSFSLDRMNDRRWELIKNLCSM